MPTSKKEIRNILVLRNDRFGEFLLNIPALRALKETFINAKIIAVVNPYVRELAQSVPFIDEIIGWGQEKHCLPKKFRLINLLKTKKIDMAIMLNPSKEFNIFTYLSGIPVRVGYDRKWSFLLTHKMQDKKYLGQKHEVEYNLELVGLVGATTQDETLSLNINSDIMNDTLKELDIGEGDRLIAIHPFTSDPIKQWPQTNFAQLAKKLVKELNIKTVIVGGRNELSKSKELFNLEINIINLIGKTTLKQLAVFFKKCQLLISGDSGPVHLACTVGLPVLAIFRSDMPGKSARRWGPWGKGHIVIEKNNLDAITIDEVFNKIKEVIDK